MAYNDRPHLRHTRNRPLRMEFVDIDNSSATFSVSPSPASSCSSDYSTITAPSLDSASSDTTIVELERLGLGEENTQQDSQQEEKVPSSESTGATPNPTMLSQIENLKNLTERARACDLDPHMLFLAEIMAKATTPTVTPTQQPQHNHSRYDILAKQIGVMQEGEDIFAVLHRFQYTLKANNVPQQEYLKALPAVLVGQYKEAYFNNVEGCRSYTQMRDTLLAVGGYTANECLNSFPLK